MRIAYLTEHGLSTDGLEKAFRFIYPDSSIERISFQDINKDALSKFKIVIFPGNNTEESPYPDFLNQDRISILKDAMEKDGMILIAFCAAAYFMADRIIYETKDGEIKARNGSGLINGIANHAFRHLTRNQKPHNYLNDYIEAKVTPTFKRASTLSVLNVNGPAILIDKNETCRVFLRYEDEQVQGAAAIIKEFGKGKLFAFGVHPELTYKGYPRYKEVTTKNPLEKFAGLFVRHESDRYALLTLIKNAIEDSDFVSRLVNPETCYIKDNQNHYEQVFKYA